jgi:hypothetical protein
MPKHREWHIAINVCALKMVEVPKFFTKNNEISGVVWARSNVKTVSNRIDAEEWNAKKLPFKSTLQKLLRHWNIFIRSDDKLVIVWAKTRLKTSFVKH